MMKYRYTDGSRRCIRIGDIVTLREGEVQIVGEVVFREKSKSFEQGMDMGVGVHIRVLCEMVEKDGKCSVAERSGRIVRDMVPERLTLIARCKDGVRYMTGEPIREGDIVAQVHDSGFSLHSVHLYEGNGDAGNELSRMGITYIQLSPNLKCDPPGKKIRRLPAFAYWTEDGHFCEQIQHLVFVGRSA